MTRGLACEASAFALGTLGPDSESNRYSGMGDVGGCQVGDIGY